MKKIEIAFSSCPNDTFIFHAMLHGLVDTEGLEFVPYISDVEDLNIKAQKGTFPISKLSFHAYLRLREKYTLLDSGSALGYGCGPLVIAKKRDIDLASARIAIPGEYTTAAMLLRLWKPGVSNLTATRFDNILEGVAGGEYDAGVIIHEGRFVYPDYDLVEIVDLGQWWENTTDMPIPLGCIALRSDLDDEYRGKINRVLRASVEYALEHREASSDYVRSHAREMDKDVINEHIKLYVNNFSIDLGERGRAAVEKLEEMARESRIIL